jgi:hypothetical protein
MPTHDDSDASEGEIQIVIHEDGDTEDEIAVIGGIDIQALRSEAHAHPGTIAGVIVSYIDQARNVTWYVHKYEIALHSGGPEEGGWWFTDGDPVDDWEVMQFPTEALAYEQCRILNDQENIRRESEEEYGFTSVLSHRSRHYTYSVETTPTPEEYPLKQRPHYE